MKGHYSYRCGLFVLFVVLFGVAAYAQEAKLPESPWHFLDTETIGAYDFLKAHPTFDGDPNRSRRARR